MKTKKLQRKTKITTIIEGKYAYYIKPNLDGNIFIKVLNPKDILTSTIAIYWTFSLKFKIFF